MILGLIIGGTAGAIAMAILSVNSYEKGYKDGRGIRSDCDL
jgi:hypothetical protein